MAEREEAKVLFHKLEAFQDELKIQKLMAQDSGETLPMIEADRDVIAYYNKGLMQHVDKVGYFIMSDVAVCERGKSKEVLARIAAGEKDYNQA